MTLVPIANARPVESLWDFRSLPCSTDGGVACGECSKTARELSGNRRAKIYHASTDHVRYCFEVRALDEAEARAEQKAERSFANYDECGQLIQNETY